jgi:protein DGCR14
MRSPVNVVCILIVLFSSQGRAEAGGHGKNARQRKAFQALVIAVDRDDVATARKLISRGVDVDGKSTGDSSTDRPLARAARRGNLEMVAALLDAGANPDWCCCSCVTALHVAIRGQHLVVARRLIEAGANVKLLCDGTTSPCC